MKLLYCLILQQINPKLILVDGITGSGKSTTAYYIARQLQRNGIKAKWYYEEEKGYPILKISKQKKKEDMVQYCKRSKVKISKAGCYLKKSVIADKYISVKIDENILENYCGTYWCEEEKRKIINLYCFLN